MEQELRGGKREWLQEASAASQEGLGPLLLQGLGMQAASPNTHQGLGLSPHCPDLHLSPGKQSSSHQLFH